MDDRSLSLLLDLAMATGRLYGRLLAELTDQDAIDGITADNLLVAEERLIANLRGLPDHDPQSVELLRVLIEQASTAFLDRCAAVGGGPEPPPPHGLPPPDQGEADR